MGRFSACLALVLLLCSCGTTQESRNIRLDVSGSTPKAAARLPGSIQIMPFTARGLLNERRLVYSDAQSPGERKQSASFMWEESPAQAATLIAVQVLRSADIAKAVFAPEQAGLADYTLSVRVDRFELEQDANGSRARVALDATVFKSEGHEIRMNARYCARSEIATDDSAAIEHAFGEAYRQTLLQLIADIARGSSAPRETAASC